MIITYSLSRLQTVNTFCTICITAEFQLCFLRSPVYDVPFFRPPPSAPSIHLFVFCLLFFLLQLLFFVQEKSLPSQWPGLWRGPQYSLGFNKHTERGRKIAFSRCSFVSAGRCSFVSVVRANWPTPSAGTYTDRDKNEMYILPQPLLFLSQFLLH